MIIREVNNLIYELEDFSTIERIFRYGPIRTLGLFIYRTLNYEVLEYYTPFLEKIDNAIEYFDSTDYKASKYINKVDLGEIFNKSKIDEKSEDNMSILKNFFFGINSILSSLFKCYSDELVDNKIRLTNVTTVASLLSIKTNLESKKILVDILNLYINVLSKKPTSAINIISNLKRRYINSRFIDEVMSDLDKKVSIYAARKQELGDQASIIRKTEI